MVVSTTAHRTTRSVASITATVGVPARTFLLLAVLLGACAAPSPTGPSPTGPSSAGPSATGPSPAGPSSPRPSVDGHPLSELLPISVNGVATTSADTSLSSRNSPRVFLRVVALLGKKPPDGELAVAASSGATVYALRVLGASGSDSLLAFVAERTGVASPAPQPTVSIGGKEVIRVGSLGGTFLYASGDVFFYLECPDDATAADVLRQLP